eukprot:gene17774-24800_t
MHISQLIFSLFILLLGIYLNDFARPYIVNLFSSVDISVYSSITPLSLWRRSKNGLYAPLPNTPTNITQLPYANRLQVDVKIINNLNHDVALCWKQDLMAMENDYCFDIAYNASYALSTFVGHHFFILSDEQERDVVIFAGKHIYTLSDYMNVEPALDPISTSFDYESRYDHIAYVNSPDVCGASGERSYDSVGPTWRDAIRTAAYRHGLALCFCGEYNDSTTYSQFSPNPEFPLTFPGYDCNCHDNHQNDLHSTFDFYFPCGVGGLDLKELKHETNCDAILSSRLIKPLQQIRLFTIHTTAHNDRMSMKHKTWISINQLFGFERASLIMPVSFDTNEGPHVKEQFLSYCKDIVDSGLDKQKVLIMKNEAMHQQKGISLKAAS